MQASSAIDTTLAEKIKLLEKSKIYLPATKTHSVTQLDEKYKEILQRIQNPEIDAKSKAAFIGNMIPELHELYKKLESNTEIVLTTIQATEIKNIVTLLEELKILYDNKAKEEMIAEQLLAQKMHESQDLNFIASTGNELTKLYLAHGKLKLAQEQAKTNTFFAEQKLTDTQDKSLSFELYADLLFRHHQYAEAKIAYEKSASMLKKISNEKYQEKISSLLGKALMAQDHEEEAIFKNDKDLHELFQMKEILQKSGDVQLAHLAGTVINELHEKLVDPKIKPNDKITLINDFGVRWQKYLDSKQNAITKPQWYTKEMESIIKEKLATNLRTIREMFAAQGTLQQSVSTSALIEAKEEAKTQAQLRAEGEAKARRDAILAKAQASRIRIEAEKQKKLTDEKAKELAKQQAAREAQRVQEQAAERARLEAETKAAEKARYQELLNTRKHIAKLMHEAKVALDQAQKNIGRHEYKIHLQEEEKKLKEAIELFNVIKAEERIDADLTSFAKSLYRLGVALGHQGKFKNAQEYLARSIHIYQEIVTKQNYSNLAIVNSKLETQSEMARNHYVLKNYAEAEKYFDHNIADLNKVLSNQEIDESFKSVFQLSALQNQAYALLMAKLATPMSDNPVKSDHMIDLLYHANNLQKKLDEDEYKLIQHLLSLDKNLLEKSARIVRLQEILINLERPIQKRVVVFQKMLEEDTRGPLEVIDQMLLQSYFEDLVNLGFVSVLKSASDTLPKDINAFVSEIKLVRHELRNGQDVKLATLGLTLEQKIIYTLYEKQLAKLEFRASRNTQAEENINSVLTLYLEEYFQIQPAKSKIRRKWIGKMLTAIQRRRKSLKGPGKLSAAK